MADPHKPLRDDVRLLGELLGDTVRAQAGDRIFAAVERVRALAKSGRAGNDGDFRELADELSRMDVDDALSIARAFAHSCTWPISPSSTTASGGGAPTCAIPMPPRSAVRAPTASRASSLLASPPTSSTRRSAGCAWSWC